MDKKLTIDPAALGENPLAGSLRVLVRKRVFDKQYALDKDPDGEVLLPFEALIEYTPYTKLFRDADRRKRVMALSEKALKLLTWIGYELEPGRDYVLINRKRYMKEGRVKSETTLSLAIKELTVQGFVSPTVKQSVYWIDPHHFFAGSRIQKYPDHIQLYKPT